MISFHHTDCISWHVDDTPWSNQISLKQYIYACHLPCQNSIASLLNSRIRQPFLTLTPNYFLFHSVAHSHSSEPRNRNKRPFSFSRSVSSFYNGIPWICEWELELVEIYSTHKMNAKTGGGFNIESNARVRTACAPLVGSLQTLLAKCVFFVLAFADWKCVRQ